MAAERVISLLYTISMLSCGRLYGVKIKKATGKMIGAQERAAGNLADYVQHIRSYVAHSQNISNPDLFKPGL